MKKVKCIYCKQPIHIDNFIGINKEGLICGKLSCIVQLAKKLKQEKEDLN